jgi:hypothetical protein
MEWMNSLIPELAMPLNTAVGPVLPIENFRFHKCGAEACKHVCPANVSVMVQANGFVRIAADGFRPDSSVDLQPVHGSS